MSLISVSLVSTICSLALELCRESIPPLVIYTLLPSAAADQSAGDGEIDLPSQLIDFLSPPPNLTSLGNNSLFMHWRPKALFIAPNSWMNDPMAQWVDVNETWHVEYQYHHAHIQWGNISLASASSIDGGITWSDDVGWENPTTMGPATPEDHLGVFDGSIIPVGYNGYPTMIYTGVKSLPLSWNLPYILGTETQNIAWTTDSGVSWHRVPGAPALAGPPVPYAKLTGFRDPYAFQSLALDELLRGSPLIGGADGLNNKHQSIDTTRPGARWYLTLSSGVKNATNAGPRLYLYTQRHSSHPASSLSNFNEWTYLGPLVARAQNDTWSSRWSGSFGYNFETAGVVWLTPEGDAPGRRNFSESQAFAYMGTEGGRDSSKGAHWPFGPQATLCAPQQVASISISPTYWGESYACASHPAPFSRRILRCSTYEDTGTSGYGWLQIGWQGSLTLSRELFLLPIPRVDASTPSARARVEERGSWGYTYNADGSTATVTTLGVRIQREVDAALCERDTTVWTEPPRSFRAGDALVWTPLEAQPQGRYFNLSALLTFASATSPDAGFVLLRSSGDEEKTVVYYDSAMEEVVVDRSRSTLVPGWNTGADSGPLRMWDVREEDQVVRRQTLNLTVVVDTSVVEVYANEQFVLTTRVYPWLSSPTGLGYYVGPSTDDAAAKVGFSEVQVCEGLFDAWSKRLHNSSVPLVWDHTTYWDGR